MRESGSKEVYIDSYWYATVVLGVLFSLNLAATLYLTYFLLYSLKFIGYTFYCGDEAPNMSALYGKGL